MPVLAAYAVPHPPLLLPEIGRGEERKIAATAEAYREVAKRASACKPDVVLIVSPHATLYADYFHISPGIGAQGDFSAFQAPQVQLRADYDQELAHRIEVLAHRWRLPAGTMGERDKRLDHGTMLPLRFLQEAGLTCPIVRIGLSGLSVLTHYRLGQCISEAVDNLSRRAVLIASGDLSHKLTEDGPYGFAPEGPLFDKAVTQALSTGDFLAMLSLAPEMAQSAAECGWRSLQIMAGALDRKSLKPELLSYEGPFGVGYAVAAFPVAGADAERNIGEQFDKASRAELDRRRREEDPYVRLARLSLETFVRTGKRATPPENLLPELKHTRAGVFVSLHKDGLLRGCIGTILPAAASLAEEILHNALSAGSNDPRFEPVREEELPDLTYSVDVLGPTEKIASEAELDPARYGVVVQNGSRRGLLLPNLEGVHTAAQQVAIARRKAGIEPGERVRLSRFEVVRHF